MYNGKLKNILKNLKTMVYFSTSWYNIISIMNNTKYINDVGHFGKINLPNVAEHVKVPNDLMKTGCRTNYNGSNLSATYTTRNGTFPAVTLESVVYTVNLNKKIKGTLILSQYEMDALTSAGLAMGEAFDLTVKGTTPTGKTSQLTLKGVVIYEMTGGKSCSDMSDAVGYAFDAEEYIPWAIII